MAELARRPALPDLTSALECPGAQVTLRLIVDRFITRLQWRQAAGMDVSDLERLIELKLPEGPAGAAGGEPSVFWCAPGEWLVVSARVRAGDLNNALGALPENVNYAVTDAGYGLACMEIAGSGTLARLAGGCSADLESLEPDHYLFTRLFGLAALIHNRGDRSAFDLYIDRSTVRYLWDCLV